MRQIFILTLILGLCSCGSKPGALVLETWDSGKPKVQIEFLGDTSRVSREIVFHESGDTARIIDYDLDTQKIMNEKSIHPNGQTYFEGALKDGLRTGVWKSYFADGKLNSIRNYVEDKEQGQCKMYRNEGGKYWLYCQGYFKDGKERGDWLFYNSDGVVVKRKSYSSNE